MGTLTPEAYREYLVKRIEYLTALIDDYENEDCLTPKEVDRFMRACNTLDDVMERLFFLDNAVDITE